MTFMVSTQAVVLLVNISLGIPLVFQTLMPFAKRCTGPKETTAGQFRVVEAFLHAHQ